MYYGLAYVPSVLSPLALGSGAGYVSVQGVCL